jgi:hypothetical protein
MFSGAETPVNSGGKPTYKARSTKKHLRGRHPVLPVGLSPLAIPHHQANVDRSMLRFWGSGSTIDSCLTQSAGERERLNRHSRGRPDPDRSQRIHTTAAPITRRTRPGTSQTGVLPAIDTSSLACQHGSHLGERRVTPGCKAEPLQSTTVALSWRHKEPERGTAQLLSGRSRRIAR